MASVVALSDYWWDWGNLLFRWLHVIAAMAWIGASFYFIALDNHLEPPKDPRRRRARRRRRGVGGPRRRLLPRREVPRRARTPARAAALVQVGGVHDVALRLRAVRRRLLLARVVVPGRPDGRRPVGVGGDRDLDRRARRSRGSSTTGSAARSRTTKALLAVLVFAFICRVGVRLVASCSHRGRRTSRSAR